MAAQTQSQFFQSLKKYYTFYTGGFITFVGGLIFKIGKLLSQRDHKKEEKKD